MDCNRDEAIRAKTIAERKLMEKDYAGAKKFSLKAQALYPSLDGLPQMFATLDVYIAAENKISGEVDWYGVLGVNPSDDDETVRKHYRKLALMLHPDKNKSVGADGAFKLLSEAWSLLSDKVKRLAYNQRRGSKGFQPKIPSQNGFHNVFANRETPKPNNTPKNTAPPQATPVRRTDTFWTICHQCKMHYEYLKVYLNHTLLCPNCQKAFLATEMAPPVNVPKTVYPSSRQRNHVPSSNTFDPGRSAAATKNASKRTNMNWSPFSGMGATTEPSIAAKAANVVQQANEKLKREREESQKRNHFSSSVFRERMMKRRKGIDDDGHFRGNGGADTGNVSGSKKAGFETDRVHGFSGLNSKPNSTRDLNPLETRNMLMHKARVEICKKLNEWNSETEARAAAIQKEKKEEREKNVVKGHLSDMNKNGDPPEKGFTSADETDIKKLEPLLMNVPDPDFHNFDLDRTESSFGDNQIWAAYDNDDGMPRFFAMIHKVISRKPFKMKISWLNSKSTSEFGSMNWVGSGFVKTCGEFRIGKHEINKSLNSFSHKVKWARGARGSVIIYPKKDDVWALYRNWAYDWNALTPDEVVHKYDMVKVLDDYNEEQGISVTPLIKVTGFKTVFCPHLENKVMRIPKEEMFRFSHQVPNYLLTGQEARNAPKGCEELDPAASPLELLQVITEATDSPVIENLQSGVGVSVGGAATTKKEVMVDNGE